MGMTAAELSGRMSAGELMEHIADLRIEAQDLAKARKQR